MLLVLAATVALQSRPKADFNHRLEVVVGIPPLGIYRRPICEPRHGNMGLEAVDLRYQVKAR